MARLNKNETARYEGAKWVLDKIDSIGLDETKKEMEWRGVNRVPLNVEKADVTNFVESYAGRIKRSMCALVCIVLYDQFDMTKEQLELFINRWNMKCDAILGDWATWKDYADMLKEETGIDIDLPAEYYKLRAKDFSEVKEDN